jgi:hypothetical protein
MVLDLSRRNVYVPDLYVFRHLKLRAIWVFLEPI